MRPVSAGSSGGPTQSESEGVVAYVPLGIRTEYSFLDGMCRLEPLVERARALRYGTIGIADVHSAYAFVPFALAARAAGVRPIFGVTVRLQADVVEQMTWGQAPVFLKLFARDERGYRNLLSLLSRAHLESGEGEPGVGFQDLQRFAVGVLALDGGMRGPVAQSIARGDREGAERVASHLRAIFGPEAFGIEVQRQGSPDEARVEPFVVHLARKLNVPLVATSDVRYLEPADAEAHQVLRCIAQGTSLSGAARHGFAGEPHLLRSEPEMRHLFRDLPEALTNTYLIAERCQLELDLDAPIPLQVPTRSGRAPFDELQRESERGARRRYGVHDYEELPAVVRDRLAHELTVIGELELASCFLIAQGVVRYAKEEGISVGPGRGAAAGSLVCYALGITQIDPLAHGLLFERFLSRSSGRWPEFEFDVEHRHRDTLVQRVVHELRPERVAMVPSLTTLSTRSVIREVAEALGFTADETDAVARSLHADGSADLWQALDRSRELKRNYQNDVRVRRLFDIARRLEGLPRNPTLHAGGLLVAPTAITDVAALQRTRSGEVVAQISSESAAAVGLLRLEFVASRALTVLRGAASRVAERQGVALALETLPLEDEPTFRLLGQGDTQGVVHFEGPSVQALLRALEPRRFADLVAVLCLSRPGARAAGLLNRYLACRRDDRDEDIVDERLRPVLGPTHGLVLYQEQVMELAREAAGYDLDLAESLRQALQRRRVGDLARHRARFLRGAVERGLDVERAEALFAALLRFANFDFDKAHGVGQALLGWTCAWVRAHHPLEFAAALLEESIGQGQRLRESVADVLEHRIPILPVDVNRSQQGFAVEDEALRMGLAMVKRLGDADAERVLEERRRGGVFVSLRDFALRLYDLPRPTFESLAKAGAFEGLGANRAQALHFVEESLDAVGREARGEERVEQLAFEFAETARRGPDGLLPLSELSPAEIEQLESEALEIDLREIARAPGRERDRSVLELPFALAPEPVPSRLRSGTHASTRRNRASATGGRRKLVSGSPRVPHAERPGGSPSKWGVARAPEGL